MVKKVIRDVIIIACAVIIVSAYCAMLTTETAAVKPQAESVPIEAEPMLAVESATERTAEPANETIEQEAEPEPTEQLEYLGSFLATAYCPCTGCSDDYGRSTATGAIATEGRTIAVDPRVIPYGSVVVINGHEYIAEDCGGLIKGNRVDIFFDSHADTDKFGVKHLDVYIRN